MRNLGFVLLMIMLCTIGISARAATTTDSFNVNITLTAGCIISTAPGNIALSYTAFQSSAASANTTFGVKCSTNLPYTLAVAPTSGGSYPITDSAVGVAYSLNISTTAGGSTVTSSTGTGSAQSYFINASATSGQAGTCTTSPGTGTCVNTAASNKNHTLTITY